MGLLDLLFGSSSSNSEKESVTVDIGKLGWRPALSENILVAHEKCQLLTENGASLASTQYFTCCVTDKGLVLIPEGDYKTEKKVLGLGLSSLGISGIRKRVTLYYVYKNYIDSPIYVERDNIKSAEADIYSILNGKFVRYYVKLVIDDETLFLGVQEVGYSMDIVASIYQPELFAD